MCDLDSGDIAGAIVGGPSAVIDGTKQNVSRHRRKKGLHGSLIHVSREEIRLG